MGLIAWLKRDHRNREKRRREWRAAWRASIDSNDGAGIDDLRARLAPLEEGGGDVEIEIEMLDALEHLATVRRELSAGGLPVVETQHRVIGGEACHFTAPASVPTDPAQPSGRVLFTPSRSLFVGGGKTTALPWHAVLHIVRQDRDLLLARADGISGAQFRFNTYGDAVVAALLATALKASRK